MPPLERFISTRTSRNYFIMPQKIEQHEHTKNKICNFRSSKKFYKVIFHNFKPPREVFFLQLLQRKSFASFLIYNCELPQCAHKILFRRCIMPVSSYYFQKHKILLKPYSLQQWLLQALRKLNTHQ